MVSSSQPASCVHGVRVRPRAAGRRHRAGAQLLNDALPSIGVDLGPRYIERVESKPSTPHFLVMATEAVLIDDASPALRRHSDIRLWRDLPAPALGGDVCTLTCRRRDRAADGEQYQQKSARRKGAHQNSTLSDS